jgi:hypothetical protein
MQERAGNVLELIGISNNFLNRTQMAQQLRERMDKWDYMKLKMVTRLKRLPTEWEKIFASYTLDKGLITRIYREFKNINFPKINDLVKKWANELNTTFSKEKVQMARKHLKTCSASLAIKEMQIKTTVKSHFTPVREATIK